MGYDAIKKEPALDGHLTAAPYYVRDRKHGWAIWDGSYALRNVAKYYRKNGEADLCSEGLEKFA